MLKKTDFEKLRYDAEYRKSKMRSNHVQMFWAINAFIVFMLVLTAEGIINDELTTVFVTVGLIVWFGIIASCIANHGFSNPFSAFNESLSIYKKGYHAVFHKADRDS